MSQAKVDRYKEEKANRRKTMKKEKFQNFLRKCVVGVVGIALIGWIGYSAVQTHDKNKEKQAVEIDYDALTNFQQNLNEVAAQ